MCEGQEQRNIKVKGDLRVGEASSSEIIVAKEIVQMPSVLDRVDHGALPVHQLQVLSHIYVDAGPFKKPVKKPPQKKPGLMI